MESQWIERLRRRRTDPAKVRLGIGDDAAVLEALSGETVITVDLLTEGIHFLLEKHDPRMIGRKALGVNLSDLAAMAAIPVAGVVAVAVPETATLDLLEQLADGIDELARPFRLAIVGGDTNCWSGGLVLSITVLGQTTSRGPLTRSGARPGDRILATGDFGGSLLEHQFTFTPRVHEALHLHQKYELHAGIDVSDGLALDLSRMARESGCGVVLQRGRIPIASDAHRLATQLADGRSPLDHALGDGEDFELLLAVPPPSAEAILAETPLDVPVTDIGAFTEEKSFWLEDDRGRREPLLPAGYEHRFPDG
jgi:thiamine-monophosphate kinase